MSDITIIPPFRILPDVTIPFIDQADLETYLQNIANPLIVILINQVYPNEVITINAEGNIEIGGVEFSTKFDLCKRPCLCGTSENGVCPEDIPCLPGTTRVNCECVGSSPNSPKSWLGYQAVYRFPIIHDYDLFSSCSSPEFSSLGGPYGPVTSATRPSSSLNKERRYLRGSYLKPGEEDSGIYYWAARKCLSDDSSFWNSYEFYNEVDSTFSNAPLAYIQLAYNFWLEADTSPQLGINYPDLNNYLSDNVDDWLVDSEGDLINPNI